MMPFARNSLRVLTDLRLFLVFIFSALFRFDPNQKMFRTYFIHHSAIPVDDQLSLALSASSDFVREDQ